MSALGSLVSYPTVPFRDVVMLGIGSLLHVDARDLAVDAATVWAVRINSQVRKRWTGWRWKFLRIVEERAFRQVLYPQLNYTTGTEGYFLTTASYYRALETIAPGELPDTAPTKWEAMTLTNADRYVAQAQYARRTIGKVISAHSTDPTLSRLPGPGLPYSLNGSGIQIPNGANTVWITYQPEQPMFTAAIYDPLATYAQGALVYSPAYGECYRALLANPPVGGGINQPVTNNLYWLPQEFPYFLSESVQYGVASDLSEDVQTKGLYAGEAEDRHIQEINDQVEQGDLASYSLVQQTYDMHWSSWEVEPALITII